MDLIERIQKSWVKHEQIEEKWKKFDQLRELRNKAEYGTHIQHGILIGPSGVGKSTLAEKYTDKHPLLRLEEKHKRPVVYMEIPEPFTVGEFFSSLIEHLGGTLVGTRTIGALKRRVIHHLTNLEVELLFLDEIQYINYSKHVRPEKAMELIKHIANISKVVLVLIGPPEANKLRLFNKQYKRRFEKIEIKRFNYCDQAFCNFLCENEKQIGISFSDRPWNPDEALPTVIHKMSYGIPDTIKKIYRQVAFIIREKEIDSKKVSVEILHDAYKRYLLSGGEEDVIEGTQARF